LGFFLGLGRGQYSREQSRKIMSGWPGRLGVGIWFDENGDNDIDMCTLGLWLGNSLSPCPASSLICVMALSSVLLYKHMCCLTLKLCTGFEIKNQRLLFLLCFFFYLLYSYLITFQINWCMVNNFLLTAVLGFVNNIGELFCLYIKYIFRQSLFIKLCSFVCIISLIWKEKYYV